MGGDTRRGPLSRRRWREAWSRSSPLGRIRAVFLFNALLPLLGILPQLALASRQPFGLRAVAMGAVACLAAWWLAGWRRQRFPAAAEPAEWLVLNLLAIALDDAEAALGLFYGTLAFRALYGNRRAAFARAGLAATTLVTMPVLAVATGGHEELSAYLPQIPMALTLAGVTYLLGTIIARHERAVARERVLAQSAVTVTGTTDAEAVCQTGVHTALALIGNPTDAHAALALVRDGRHEFVAAAGAGIVGSAAPPGQLPAALVRRLEAGLPAYAEGLVVDPATFGFIPKVGGLVVLPLNTGDGAGGMLVVAGDHPIPEDVRDSLQTLSNQLAIGLDRCALTAELTRRAYHDPLTDLGNRLMLQERLDDAIGRARRDGGRTGLLLIDLNDFKPINDELGHDVGDQVLIGVAARVRHCLRASDTAARLGGDEFAVVVDDAARPSAIALAERITEALRQPIDTACGPITVEASIGVAVTGEPGSDQDDPGDLLRRADVAMYQAKARRTPWAIHRPGLSAESAARSRVHLVGAPRPRRPAPPAPPIDRTA